MMSVLPGDSDCTGKPWLGDYRIDLTHPEPFRPSDNFARRAHARWVFLWVIQLRKRVIPEWAKRLARKGFRTKYTHPDEYSSYLDENLSEIEKYETQLKGRDFPQHAAKAAHYATGSDLVTIFKIGEDT